MFRAFISKHTIALVMSCLTLMALYFQQLETRFLWLVAGSYLIWGGSIYLIALRRSRVEAAEESIKSEEEQQLSEIERYYLRLLRELDSAVKIFSEDRSVALHRLKHIHGNIERAQELARNTGLLAVNAMISAARCGEVGRGFVSVSRDMVNISERSERDLLQLVQLADNCERALKSQFKLPSNPVEEWFDFQSRNLATHFHGGELEVLLESLSAFEQALLSISENYMQTSQLDVRWLQLGEAIKRVVAELLGVVTDLSKSAQKVVSELGLLNLAEKLTNTQLLEIKKRLVTIEEQAKKINEFAT